MTYGRTHGTDCFEVESFLERNEVSKLYKVRSKENGRLFVMEVETRNEEGESRPFVQESRTFLSQFFVNLRFTFQTRSKFYYILEHIGSQSLASIIKDKGPFPEFVCRFYSCEIICALEQLHRNGLTYKELDLGNILLDHANHVTLWRRFCGKEYWKEHECICSQQQLPCGKSHRLESEFKEDWQSLGGVICGMLSGENCLDSMQQRETSGFWQPVRLPSSLSACAGDLVRGLVRGDVSHVEQVKAHPFFAGVDWSRVTSRTTPAPAFPWSPSDAHPPQASRQRSDSTLSSGSYRDLDPRHVQPHNHAIDPYMGKENIHGYPRDRPQSPYDYNEQGKKRYRASSPLIGRPIYNAHSTPDLAAGFQGRAVPGPSYLSSEAYQTSPVHLGAADHSVGDRIFASRSLTDLSNIPFEPMSPRAPHPGQRSPSLGDAGPWYPVEPLRARTPNGWDHRSHSDPTYIRGPPPYGNVSYGYSTESRYYGDGGTYSGRSSPAPSHPGTSFTSQPGMGYPQSPRDYFSPRRSFSSESDYSMQESDRSFSHSPTERFRKRSSSSTDMRAVSPRDGSFYQADQRYRLREQSPNAPERSPNAVRDYLREKPPLARASSCSVVEREQRTLVHSPNNRHDNREKYPLAQMPIPSFEEFKNRNKKQPMGDRVASDEPKDQNDAERRPQVSSVKTLQAESSSSSSLVKQGTLSSLYESAKDIGGQNTRKISESKSSSPRDAVSPRRGSIGSPLRSRENSRALARSLAESKTAAEGQAKKGYFGKNEVLHNLMTKYGLYDRRATRGESGLKAENRTETSQKREQDGKDRAGELEEEEKAPRVETSNSGASWRTRRTSLLKSAPKSPLGTPRRTQESSLRTSKGTRESPLGTAPGTQENPLGTPRGTQKSPLGTSRGMLGSSLGTPGDTMENTSGQPRGTQESPSVPVGGGIRRFSGARKSDVITSPVLANLLDKYNLRSSRTGEEGKPGRESRRKAKKTGRELQTEVDGSEGDPRLSCAQTARNPQPDELDSNMAAPARKVPIFDKAEPKSVVAASNAGAVPTMDFYKTTRVVMSASKFRQNTKKSSLLDSPKAERRKTEDTPKDYHSESAGRTDDARDSGVKHDKPRVRGEVAARLQRGGIHSSLLSLSSVTSADDVDTDDGLSLYSEADALERGKARGRRWESFHSNISADSGSAHMFEFDSESAITEYGDVFDENEPLESYKAEVDVERTDSGVGGDMGQTPRLRRSWEEIVQKSSEHWSIVASSARHWQEMARRSRAEGKAGKPAAKKKLSLVITDDMVECPECLKHYLPSVVDRDQPKTDNKTPKICPKCKDRRVERKEAIIELVQTEINYGNDLQILKEEFYIPMQSGAFLSPENLAAIFLNLQELLEVNTKFSSRLQKSLEESVACGDEEFSKVNVGGVFLESVEFLQAYEIYCSKQSSASILLETLQKKSELLKIFLNVTCRENPKCRKMDLSSFLLAPVQRIMKYPLMLSRICKTTPRKNPDRDKLKLAQRKVEEQLNRINALNTTVESRQKKYRGSSQLGNSDALNKLQMKKMASDILNWTLSEMQLLLYGTFQVIVHDFGAGSSWNRRGSKKAMHVFVLFCIRGLSEVGHVDSDDDGECPDHLFPGEGEVTDAAMVMLRKKTNGKYTLFKDPLMLDSCVVCRDSERKDSFEVVLMNKEVYVFKAATNKDFRRWLKHLRLHSKDLGAWRRRRNGLPNIMIKNL